MHSKLYSKLSLCLFVILCLCNNPISAQEGLSLERLSQIDNLVNAEIAKKQLPGGVVFIGRKGKVAFKRAYGNRTLEPSIEPMTVDTIFDLASLTKVVATATSVMIQVERGVIRLNDPVIRYIPEFGENGKRSITVEQLLIHRSGLIADNDIKDYEQGPEKAMQNIWRLTPVNEPGTKFVYSDVNYIVLAEIVKKTSGKPIDVFAEDNIFKPLGMRDTSYNPLKNFSPAVSKRIAPTESRTIEGKDEWMRGDVHDPRAYLLGGAAGHAGLFGTADDLAIYCTMILNRGEYKGVRILSPMSITRMTEGRISGGNGGDGIIRGLGWDIASPFSSNRGDLFPLGSFGHTGFTGTSIWLDPASETFTIFLSNRVHPRLDAKKPADVTPLRSRIATIAASAVIAPPYAEHDSLRSFNLPSTNVSSTNQVKTSQALNGIDVLARDGFSILKGKRIGLITNHTGRDKNGINTIDILFKAPDVKLVALFSPEHGIRGELDQEKITDSTDQKTGLPVFSLYGTTRKPTTEMLKNIDILVFDIQDIGTRFYTYVSTMGEAMEVAAKNKVSFVVLDRVNPINGVDVQGPMADTDKLSFIAWHQLPVRHGMTAGELAQMFNKERNINADLHVVRVEGWTRSDWFDQTGLVWINPSPNMRSLTEALLYPGVGLLETTNISVGRGTDTPFEVIGAPWIDGVKLAQALNTYGLPGVRFIPIRYTPRASVHKDVECGGVNIIITDRKTFDPISTGFETAIQLRKLFPQDFGIEKYNRLLVNQKIFDDVKNGSSLDSIRRNWQADLDAFRTIRSRYLLY